MASRKNSVRSAASKAVKKSHPAVIVLAVLFFVVGAVAGVIASRKLTENDKFELIGPKEIRLALNEEYVEQGAQVISFGRDVSEKVIATSDSVDVSKDGVYYVVYTVEDLRWGDFQLVRTVVVGNPETEEGGDV